MRRLMGRRPQAGHQPTPSPTGGGAARRRDAGEELVDRGGPHGAQPPHVAHVHARRLVHEHLVRHLRRRADRAIAGRAAARGAASCVAAAAARVAAGGELSHLTGHGGAVDEHAHLALAQRARGVG